MEHKKESQNLRGELQKFTRDEIIFYITQLEFYLPKDGLHSPTYIILQERLKGVSDEIEKNITKSEQLIKQYEDKRISGIDYLIQSQAVHKEWDKLNKKQDKLWGELYPTHKTAPGTGRKKKGNGM